MPTDFLSAETIGVPNSYTAIEKIIGRKQEWPSFILKMFFIENVD
jgi:hypothetical protein